MYLFERGKSLKMTLCNPDEGLFQDGTRGRNAEKTKLKGAKISSTDEAKGEEDICQNEGQSEQV